MKKMAIGLLTGSLFFCNLSCPLQAQLTSLPSGGNKKASVSERVGITDISIHYSRPGVKGREGQIWGKLILSGFNDLGFGPAKAAPWRAGANENTTIAFSGPVRIEGQLLPAGTYGFFIAYDSSECTLIFSHNASSWGSYYYNDKEDALRVKVKPVGAEKSVEWLTYAFTQQTDSTAVITLAWEKLVIPFKIAVDYTNDQLASFRNELRGALVFSWEAWDQAAQWCLQKNINLDEALLWTDSSTGPNYGGSQSFQAWSTRAQLLNKLNRGKEADSIMKKVLPLAGMQEMHAYGRSLLALKKNTEALEVFKKNYDKYPTVFTTQMGLIRGYSATGNYKKALEYAQKALPLAPDDNNKSALDKMIKLLQAGKDVN